MSEKSIQRVIESRIKPPDRKIAIENFRKKYGQNKLQLRLLTRRGMSELLPRIEAGLLNKFTTKDEELNNYLDRLTLKRKAESAIRKLSGVEKIIGKVETFRDLRKLSVRKLIKLEDKYEGILMYCFTDIVDAKEKPDFENWKGYSGIKAGQKLKVDFHGNMRAYRSIGASDIFPPSVRCITVYKDGDPKIKRTSEKRIGLKGQNKSGRGFFDYFGYIPIFTGDVVLVGGEKNPSKYVDNNFDKPFRNKFGKLDSNSYKKYDSNVEAQTDRSYLLSITSVRDTPFHTGYGKKKVIKKIKNKKRPYWGRKFRARIKPDEIIASGYSPARIRDLLERVRVLPIQQRIAEIAIEIARHNNIYARHCGDWVKRIYCLAGVTRKRNIYHDISYAFKTGRRINGRWVWKDKDNPSRWNCGKKHYPFEKLIRVGFLQPGDWLWANGFVKSGAGNHSVIFLKWRNRKKGLAMVASYLGKKYGQKVHMVNLKKHPVVHIARPTYAA